jgi:hypothetical protein
MLPDVEVETLYKRRIDLPAAGRQHTRDRLKGPKLHADIAPAHPAGVGAVLVRTEVLLGIDGAPTSPCAGEEGWRGGRSRRTRFDSALTRVAERLVDEAREGLGSLDRFWMDVAGVGLGGCVPFRPRSHTQYRHVLSHRSPSSRRVSYSPSYPISSPSHGNGREIYHLYIRVGNYPFVTGTPPVGASRRYSDKPGIAVMSWAPCSVHRAMLLPNAASAPSMLFFSHACLTAGLRVNISYLTLPDPALLDNPCIEELGR